MEKKKLFYATIPFVMALVTLVACGQDGQEQRPEHVDVASAAVACGLPLDEFTPVPSVWRTLDVSGANPSNHYDITAALQTYVSSLGTATTSTKTLLIPAGAWTINKPIMVRGVNFAAIVGADPATTSITWAGGAAYSAAYGYPDMFRVVDLTSLKLSRLTIDGNHQARTGVHLFQSTCYNTWVNYAHPYPYDNTSTGLECDLTQTEMDATGGIVAMTRIEFNDDVFQHLEFGVAAGVYAYSIGEVNFGTGLVDSRTSAPLHFSGSNVGDVLVRRSRFDDISSIGVSVEGSNAFNWLVADSEFSNSYHGIQVSQSGGVHVINNHFKSNGFQSWTNQYVTPPATHSGGMDIAYIGFVGAVIRGNLSEGSRQFLFLGPFGLLSSCDVSGNYIRTPYNALFPLSPSVSAGGYKGAPIELDGTQLTLFDNFIQMTGFPATTPPAIPIPAIVSHGFGSWSPMGNLPRITHGGNTFVTDDASNVCSATCGGASCSFFQKDGTIFADSPPYPAPVGLVTAGAVEEIVVEQNNCFTPTAMSPSPCASSSAPAFAAACSAFASAVTPVVAPSVARPIGIVGTIAPACLAAPVAGGASCAGQLNGWLTAQKSAMAKPLLFFPVQTYFIDTTIEVPNNFDVAIAGDGSKSQLIWQGKLVAATESYVFHFNSPSLASLRDLSIFVDNDLVSGGGMTPAGGVLIDSPDDVGGLVFLDTVGASFAKSYVDILGLDNVAVRADLSGGSAVERAIGITGGGKASPANGGSTKTQGLLMVAGGASSVSSYVELKNWGKAVLIGVDNEGATQGMDLTQSGYLTLATGRFLSQRQLYSNFADQPNTVVHSTFRGRVTLMNLTSRQAVLLAASATPAAQVLSLDSWYVDYGALGAEQPQVTVPCAAVNDTVDCSFYTKLSATAVVAVPPTQLAVQDGTECVLVPAHLDSLGHLVPTEYGYSYCRDNKPSALSDPATAVFVKAMLADERAVRMGPPLACSTTAVRMHRVGFQGTPLSVTQPKSFMGAAVRVQRF
jgi:hypothetical protein